MSELSEFFTGLQKSLAEAITPAIVESAEKVEKAVEVDKASELEAVKKALDMISKAFDLTPVEGEEASALSKAITGISESLETHTNVLEKALARIEKLEGHTSVSKALTDEEVVVPEVKAGKFDNVMKSLLRNGSVSLTG